MNGVYKEYNRTLVYLESNMEEDKNESLQESLIEGETYTVYYDESNPYWSRYKFINPNGEEVLELSCNPWDVTINFESVKKANEINSVAFQQRKDFWINFNRKLIIKEVLVKNY